MNNLDTVESVLDPETGLDDLLRSVLIDLSICSSGDGKKRENWDMSSC